MVSLSISSSNSSRSSSVHSSRSHSSLRHVSPSPSNFSLSSSGSSSNLDDDENLTITLNRPLFNGNGKEKSHEDLHLLAVSTRMTELSYSISDLQTRIFEIQELRHKSQSANEASNATGVIDQSLASLDERMDIASTGIKSVNETLEPLLQSSQKTPVDNESLSEEDTIMLRKHAALMTEWEGLQKDVQVLREELKEDKWLTVFRTVTDQADGMMSSLEKAVNRCQDFIWKMHKHGLDDSLSPSSSTSSIRSDKSPLNIEVFTSLLDSFEAKKKHYMPATAKVLSIIDKGVQDRVTKNGECLRRHAESTQRWRNLQERISRTDTEMEVVRKLIMSGDTTPSNMSEAGSSASGATSKSKKKNGLLSTPPTRQVKERTQSSNTLSRSISPFRKLARRFTRSSKPPATPAAPKSPARVPSSEPVRTLKHRASMLHFMGSQPQTPMTPSHKHSHSLTPESSPSSKKLERLEVNSTLKHRPAWNSSTKVESEDRSATVKSSPRRPSISGLYRSSDQVPPVPPLYPPYNRSVSRSSMASSRPWSPVTSSVSTAHSSNTPFSMYRPPSRSQAQTPGPPSSMYRPPSRSEAHGIPMSPRTRPKTPSHIPAPSTSHYRSMSGSPSDGGWEREDSLSSVVSPGLGLSHSHSSSISSIPARPPSRSMIPIPSVHVSAASRPSSAMSQFRPESSMSFRDATDGARTPDAITTMRMTPRPMLQHRMPPSSFRDSPSASPRTPGPSSRPPSRVDAVTSGGEREGFGKPEHEYVPINPRDPLDAEVAHVANSLAHCLLIERIDPPLRGTPKEGEEIRAQYAFTGPLARKVVNCKLTTLARPGAKGVTRKVMCRVGGGTC
ncbi:uncharacterized protein FIBRA_03872 [Fibroporia radiculosa]|uniref:GAR domain-containing protein n=1 Tax=Fibroporia radiculosa TaxID=599839 RepID=J4GNQ6_9APHY|nr:uncharacterized protein FIBRA_03872 [Fibroporia radiculosa]CCM01805.1 predicted protein [Fibroporia radiculosa]